MTAQLPPGMDPTQFEQYDVRIVPGDYDRGFVMTVYDRHSGEYLFAESWGSSSTPRPFLSATGLRESAGFASLLRGIVRAAEAWLSMAKKATERVDPRLKEAFAQEVHTHRDTDGG